MSSIFISYRRSDSAGHAGRIFERLRYWFADDELFFDVNSIGWGADFPDEIQRSIFETRAVLVVIGPDWIQLLNQRVAMPGVDFVRREVSIALARKASNEVDIFPVLVGGAGMPTICDFHDQIRDELGKLVDYHAHEFPADVRLWDCQFERLRQSLKQVNGVPQPSAQIGSDKSRFTLRNDRSESTRRPPMIDVEEVTRALGAVSSALLNWPQETGGRWIERSELDHLHELATGSQPTVTALLGGPGEGKSAILARLGTRLSKEGVVLLAIKADQLPRSTATLRDLDHWMGCQVPLAEALRHLATQRRVVVLIDQLDALADLMDQHSERLSSLTMLVNSLTGVSNLNVIVSCREFEFRNDVRFNALNAEELSLVRLSWEQVEPLLTARGLETSGWSQDVQSVLRTPQHLAMFLQHQADNSGRPPFTTYQGLLADIVRDRVEAVHGRRTVEAAEHIATSMAQEEELWLGRDRFERDFGPEIERLFEANLLVMSDSSLSMSFRHQTLFDFLRARAFLRNRQSLAEYIVDLKRQSLFVRPILWSTLTFLRASDKPSYREQLEGLWYRKNLRTHIQNLLVDFLGRLPDPDDQEANWLLSRLDKPGLHQNILRATAGSPGWFRRLQNRLPALMTAEPTKVEGVTAILSRAASFEPRHVLRAVDRYWVSDERYLPYALTVLQEVRSWDESNVDIIYRLAGKPLTDTSWVQSIAKKISDSSPDLAPTVVVRNLLVRLRDIDRNALAHCGKIAPERSDCGQPEELQRTQDRSKLNKQLIDNDSEWYGVEEIAKRAPRVFIEKIWPFLVEVFTRLSRDRSPLTHSYQGHHGLAFKRSTSQRCPLQAAIEIGVRTFAEQDMKNFIDFLEKEKTTDLKVLHRLLSFGLETIARKCPRVVLQYLLEDSRRFSLGHMNNERSDTQALISAAVPQLEQNDVLRLETAILQWTWFRSTPRDCDGVARRERRKWMRALRLQLLSVFPFERLSPEAQRHIKEANGAMLEASKDDTSSGAVLIASPMSAEQMEKASDAQILDLFQELTDETEWDHPTRRHEFVGGSVQASREFAEFASNAPHRAINLVRRFEAGKMERPAGAALATLARGSLAPDTLIKCIRALNERGFASESFRRGVAECFSHIALRSGGLSDDVCSLLEAWIIDRVEKRGTVLADSERGSPETVANRKSAHKGREKSLLWNRQRSRILPQGNYPLLSAIMRGYLCREPSNADRWLAMLERHLARREDPAVWREVAEDLWRLAYADRKRASMFLEELFFSCQDILHTTTGVSLVARVMSWIPTQLFDRVIVGWISGSWQHGPQAAGELLALKFCRNPDDVGIGDRVEGILSGDSGDYCDLHVIDGLRLGATHTLIVAWSEPALRALTTRILVRLSKMRCVAVERALSGVFGKADPLPTDDHTRILLEALLERPSILVRGGRFLLKGLKGFLRSGWNPMLVYRISTAFISQKTEDLGNIRTRFAAHAGDFADIALTLHRIPETRELGLELFECLMDARSYGLEERIAAIDRPAFR